MNNITTATSVVITALANDTFVNETLNSAIKQTIENKEIILVISNLAVNPFFLNFLPNYDNLKIIAVDELLNASEARNRGIEASNGRYIAFLDSDDTWEPTKLSKQVSALEEENANFCATNFAIFSNRDQIICEKEISKNNLKFNSLLYDNRICYSSVVVQREFLSFHRFNETLERRNDLDLWLRLARENIRTTIINETLTYYRFHPGSLSSNKILMIKYQWNYYFQITKKNWLKTIFLTIIYTFRKTVAYMIDGRLSNIIIFRFFNSKLGWIFPPLIRYICKKLKKQTITENLLNKTQGSKFRISFEPNDIHFGDVLFWLPTLIFLKKNRFLDCAKFGVKSEIFCKEFLTNFETPQTYKNSKTSITIGFSNAIDKRKYNLHFDPLKIPLNKSIARSIFKLFSSDDAAYDKTIEIIKTSKIFDWQQNDALQEVVRNKTIVCLDAQTRGILAKRKRERLIKTIKRNPEKIFVAIGLENDFKLPKNVIDLRKIFSIQELLGLVHYDVDGFLGLDNFWAHYFGLFGYKTKVKFRGSFLYNHGKLHLAYFLRAFR